MKKNVASQIIGAQLVSKTDGSAVTSGTTTIYVTGDGGTQAAGSVGSGACTHEGNGYWTYAPAQAETNYDQIGFTFVNTSACNVTVQVYPSFPQTGDSFARLGAPAGASVSADVAAMKVDTAAILVDTGTTLDARIPAALVGGRMDVSVGAMAADVVTSAAIAANAIGASELAQDAAQEIADEILNRDLAGGGSGNTRNVRNALRSLRNKAAIAGGTLTVYQENDTDAAWTAAVTTAAGDPIDSIDPA